MPTLGTQNISTSYGQLLKTFGLGGLDGTLQVITDGDNTSSALSLSTSGVQSTGSFTVSSNTTLFGQVTFGTSFTASTGTATIGTLLVAGPSTFGSSFTASTGTATIGTLSVGTQSIGTSTVNISTVSSATFGTARITGSTGGVTAINYGTAAFTTATVPTSGSSTGTFAINGLSLNDIVHGSLNSIGSATGSQALSFFVFAKAANVAQYTLCNVNNTTISTVPAGTIYATAVRMVT